MNERTKPPIWGWLAITLSLTFFLGLAKVWVNIERVELSYRIQVLQNEYRENQELRTKLTIEKNNLLSPYRLREMGEEMGMFSPAENQTRKIRNNY